MIFISRPYCDRLGTPLAYSGLEVSVSSEAIINPPPYQRARSVCVYNEPAARIIRRFKYYGQTEIAKQLSQMMAIAADEFFCTPTHTNIKPLPPLIVSVPLHPRRLMTRTFNQSALLAEGVARYWKIPFHNTILRRIRPTLQQVGLTHIERQANVRGAFLVPDDRLALVHSRRIVLVDDIFTTGATLCACTRALKRAGASQVDILTFAKVVHDT